MSNYLHEAFQAFKLFEDENTFKADASGLDEFDKFMHSGDDVKNEVSVFDVDATSEEELQDSYLGKVILMCPICRSMIYKDIDELNIGEDEDLDSVDTVCEDTECPYCFSQEGFKVVGKVAPYDESEPAEFSAEQEVEPEEDEEDTDDDVELEDNDEDDIEDEDNDEDDELGEGLIKDIYNDAKGSIKNYFANRKQQRANDRTARINQKLDNIGSVASKATTVPSKVASDALEGGRKVIRSIGGTAKDAGEAAGNAKDAIKNVKGAIKVAKGLKNEGVGAALLGAGVAAAGAGLAGKAIKDAPSKMVGNSIAEPIKQVGNIVKPIKNAIVGEDIDEESLKEAIENIDVTTDDEIIHADQDDNGKLTITTEPKMDEDFPSDDLEDEEMVDNSNGEMIAPLDSDDEAEIDDTLAQSTEQDDMGEDEFGDEDFGDDFDLIDNDEEEGGDEDFELVDNDEEESPEEEVEQPETQFDNESFDRFSNRYLKSIYENVENYKTKSVKRDKNGRLKVEGVISFMSGTQKDTAFLFTKDEKNTLIGENLNITPGKKSFKVKCYRNSKKLIPESFTYNYKQKDSDGNTRRLYGTITD